MGHVTADGFEYRHTNTNFKFIARQTLRKPKYKYIYRANAPLQYNSPNSLNLPLKETNSSFDRIVKYEEIIIQV